MSDSIPKYYKHFVQILLPFVKFDFLKQYNFTIEERELLRFYLVEGDPKKWAKQYEQEYGKFEKLMLSAQRKLRLVIYHNLLIQQEYFTLQRRYMDVVAELDRYRLADPEANIYKTYVPMYVRDRQLDEVYRFRPELLSYFEKKNVRTVWDLVNFEGYNSLNVFHKAQVREALAQFNIFRIGKKK